VSGMGMFAWVGGNLAREKLSARWLSNILLMLNIGIYQLLFRMDNSLIKALRVSATARYPQNKCSSLSREVIRNMYVSLLDSGCIRLSCRVPGLVPRSDRGD